jgi:hypothetical protein
MQQLRKYSLDNDLKQNIQKAIAQHGGGQTVREGYKAFFALLRDLATSGKVQDFVESIPMYLAGKPANDWALKDQIPLIILNSYLPTKFDPNLLLAWGQKNKNWDAQIKENFGDPTKLLLSISLVEESIGIFQASRNS